MTTNTTPKGASSLRKALSLLDIVNDRPEGATLAEIAREAGIARPTVYRMTAAFIECGYLQQDDSSRKVTLGPKFLEMAQTVWRETDLRAAARPELEKLAASAGATALLMVRSGDHATCIEMAAAARAVSGWRVGQALPAADCAGGLAMLAFGNWDSLDEDLRAMGVPDAKAIKSRLGVARSRFYAVDPNAETTALGKGVAAPVFDLSGTPIAAVCLYGGDALPHHDLGAAVVQAARQISRMRGGYPFGINVPDAPSRHAPADDRLIADVQCLIGDNPIVAEGKISWIDILAPAFFNYDEATGDLSKTQLGEVVGACIPITGRGCLLAQQTRLALVSPSAEETWSRPVSGLPAGFRYNDGAVDARGRIWLGAMDMATSRGTGLLHRYDTLDAEPVVLPGFSLPNGIAFSPDGTQMLVVDSMERTLSRFHYAADTGEAQLVERHPLLADSEGRPSGLVNGPDGSFFTCHWDGAEVVQIDDKGRRIRSHRISVPRPSGLAYDPAAQRLVVTTARVRLSDSDLETYPRSGGVFDIRLTG